MNPSTIPPSRWRNVFDVSLYGRVHPYANLRQSTINTPTTAFTDFYDNMELLQKRRREYFLLLSVMNIIVCHPSSAFCVLPPGPATRVPTLLLKLNAAIGDAVHPDPPLPNFCSNCGSSSMQVRVPPDDERPRACCAHCNYVVYVNPKVVVATVVFSPNDAKNSQIECLLARRAIEPRKGFWGIPQGYMELGETTRQAAVREVYEETGAIIHADQLRFRALYNVPGSVQLVYEAACPRNELNIATSTLESTDIGFFTLDSLPDLCFPTVQWALDHCTRQNAEGSTAGVIQQKTKFYDATQDIWSEYEDEVG